MKKRILMVEDDLGLGESMERAFSARGHEVTWAIDLAAAILAMEESLLGIDVVLCDYQFPAAPGGLKNEPNGPVFLNELGRYYGDGDLPLVILWSGLDRTEEAGWVLEIVPDHILVKSATLEVLDLIEAEVEA